MPRVVSFDNLKKEFGLIEAVVENVGRNHVVVEG